MTPNAKRLREWIESEYPGIFKFGVRNCRKIRGSTSWSQHAEGNALDIHQRDGGLASNGTAPHLVELAGRLLAMKGTFHEYGWGIFHILWNFRSLTTGNRVGDHDNHIHVDFYPKMKSNASYVPPCKGGSLVVIYPDGTKDDEWKLWPEEVELPPSRLPGEDDEMSLKRGDEGAAVASYQEALIKWDENALPGFGADGDFGGETEEWVKKFQAAYDLPETGVIDGVTAGLLATFLAVIPPEPPDEVPEHSHDIPDHRHKADAVVTVGVGGVK